METQCFSHFDADHPQALLRLTFSFTIELSFH